MSQPRALSADIPASQKWVYLLTVRGTVSVTVSGNLISI